MVETTSSRDLNPVFEPLSISAPIAHQLAHEHCQKGPLGGICLTYHSIWQYLRLIGQISTIAADDDFFPAQLARLFAEGGHQRVLISAAADYGMLARVTAGARAAGVTPEITLVDICPTPLRLNRWYAEQLGISVQTRLCNILEFEAESPFDIICTHSFIGRMLDHREALLERWRTLLRPGGKALTSARIRYDVTEAVQRFTAAEAEAFADQAARLAKSAPELGHLSVNDIREGALKFAREKLNYPLYSREYLIEICERAGFEVKMNTRGVQPPTEGRPTSPRTGSGTERLRLILTRG